MCQLTCFPPQRKEMEVGIRKRCVEGFSNISQNEAGNKLSASLPHTKDSVVDSLVRSQWAACSLSASWEPQSSVLDLVLKGAGVCAGTSFCSEMGTGTQVAFSRCSLGYVMLHG